ncbi:MAG: hypothetical protein QOI48_2613 [Solirubrobacteraceae bacterium]|nr:hypothetical protein [Solirubrobacteraceae bacterium]
MIVRGAFAATADTGVKARGLMVAAGGYQDWYIGLGLSFGVIVVVVIIVAIILTMAARIADQAGQATTGVDVVRAQRTSLEGGVDRVNDSAVRILHMARVLRKVAVGK